MLIIIRETLWCFLILNPKAYLYIRYEDNICTLDNLEFFDRLFLVKFKKYAKIRLKESKNAAKKINIAFLNFPSLLIFFLYELNLFQKIWIFLFFSMNYFDKDILINLQKCFQKTLDKKIQEKDKN